MMTGALGGANYGNTAADPKNGIMYIMTQEYASIYKLAKVAPPKIDLSENEIKKVKTLYASTCQTCHGESMAGGAGPSLLNLGQRIFWDEFKGIVTNGSGQMPGFSHVDEETLKALYRYLGGNPRSFNFSRRGMENKTPEGPVVASGGVKIKPDAKRNAP